MEIFSNHMIFLFIKESWNDLSLQDGPQQSEMDTTGTSKNMEDSTYKALSPVPSSWQMVRTDEVAAEVIVQIIVTQIPDPNHADDIIYRVNNYYDF